MSSVAEQVFVEQGPETQSAKYGRHNNAVNVNKTGDFACEPRKIIVLVCCAVTHRQEKRGNLAIYTADLMITGKAVQDEQASQIHWARVFNLGMIQRAN